MSEIPVRKDGHSSNFTPPNRHLRKQAGAAEQITRIETRDPPASTKSVQTIGCALLICLGLLLFGWLLIEFHLHVTEGKYLPRYPDGSVIDEPMPVP